MNSDKPKNNKPGPKKPMGRIPQPKSPLSSNFWIWVGGIIIILMMLNQPMTVVNSTKELSYREFYSILKDNVQTKKIQSLSMTEDILQGSFSDGSKFIVNIPPDDEALLSLIRTNVSQFSVVPLKTFWSQFLFTWGPMLLLISFIWFASYRGAQIGNKIWSFGKSRAKANVEKANRITFEDVAGVDEAEEELQEIIEFLKDPKKFQKLGGRIPKGVLLVGPPGTGQTLLAKE